MLPLFMRRYTFDAASTDFNTKCLLFVDRFLENYKRVTKVKFIYNNRYNCYYNFAKYIVFIYFYITYYF